MKWLRRWLLGREPSENAQDAPGSTIAYLAGRLDTLEKHTEAQAVAMQAFTSALADVRLEWASTLDKLNRWTARESARQRRRFERESEGLSGEPTEAAPAAAAPSGDPRLLTKSQLRAQYAGGRLSPKNGAGS